METVSWQSAHYEEPFASRRKAKLKGKLHRMGVAQLPRDARILDTCCGNGDALAELYALGFRNLQGIDGISHADWPHKPFPMVAGDVRQLPFEDSSFDAVTNMHALHHLGGPQGTKAFLDECFRVLRPGGRLYILDFPSSPQIQLLFWGLRKRLLTLTPGLENFAKIVDEEWSYLEPYLNEWRDNKKVLFGHALEVEKFDQRLFLYSLCLKKPEAMGRQAA